MHPVSLRSIYFVLSLEPFGSLDEDYPSADEPSKKEIQIFDNFIKLKDFFHTIYQSLCQHVDPGDVRAHLTLLDSMLLKEASAIVDTVSDKLETKGTLTKFPNSSLWNFMDYHLMEYIIEKFGSEDLKSDMTQYKRDLLTFENGTTIFQLIQIWDFAPKDDPTATVKIDKDPKCVTVSELDMLRKKFCGEFWPRLSKYASHVLHNCKLMIGHSCFILTWSFHSGIRSQLEEKARKAQCHGFFVRNKVLSFSIGNEEVYNVIKNQSKFSPGILFHLLFCDLILFYPP